MSLPIGGGRQNTAPLIFTIYADILRVTSSNLALNRGRVVRLRQLDPSYALFCSIQLHFAADQKQLTMSYPTLLCGLLSTTRLQNFVILA